MTGSLQVKNGKYYMVLNSTENGKRKQKWLSTGLTEKGNKRRAEQMLREKLRQHEVQSGIVKSEVLFSDYIRIWLTDAKRKVDLVTYQGYEVLVNSQVFPYFSKSGVKLQDVTVDVLQNYMDLLTKAKKLLKPIVASAE